MGASLLRRDFGAVAAVFSAARVQQAYARVKRTIDAVMGGVLICLGTRLVLSR